MWNFYLLKFFYFLHRNENTKRPGFYTLLVTRGFPNIPQLKQLNKINNTLEYCNLLELWSAWVADPRQLWETLLWLCFFPCLTTMVSLSTCMMCASPKRFMVCMMYVFLNRPFLFFDFCFFFLYLTLTIQIIIILLLYIIIFTYISTWCYNSIF